MNILRLHQWDFVQKLGNLSKFSVAQMCAVTPGSELSSMLVLWCTRAGVNLSSTFLSCALCRALFPKR